jgi:exo-1,4-beta-D-glucosaminidase
MGQTDMNTFWYFEPIQTYADFSALATLPQVSLTGTKSTQPGGAQSTTSVALQNSSANIAFFTRVQVLDGSGNEILPVLWDDDYVSILPGTSKTVMAKYATSLAGAGDVTVKVSGENVMPMTL